MGGKTSHIFDRFNAPIYNQIILTIISKISYVIRQPVLVKFPLNQKCAESLPDSYVIAYRSSGL